MKFKVEIENINYEIEIHGSGGVISSCNINGKKVQIEHFSRFEGSKYLLIKDGKTFEIFVNENSRNQYEVTINGKMFKVNPLNDKDIKEFSNDKSKEFEGKVVSSIMPGKVVKVFAKVGLEVDKGEPLLIVEAMKMENELKSPSRGVVKKVNAIEGKTIEANSPLVIIE